MSKLINFNARDFRFDESCQNNKGSRIFITRENENIEVFDIGDWLWNWTNIKCSMTLEKNTDYVFRFAVEMGFNDTGDAVSRFDIYFDENWDDRYCYPLEKSTFKPVVSKKYGDGLLRVYEIPFNTGNAETTHFLFSAQHAITRLCPAKELSAYDDMEDMTYEQWWDKKHNSNAGNSDFVSDSADDFDGQILNGCNVDLSGAKMSFKTLNRLMKKFGGGCNVNFAGIEITDDKDFDDLGRYADFHEKELDDTSKAEDNTDIPEFAKNHAVNGIQTGLKALQEQYDNFPEGSIEKSALKTAMDEMKSEIAKFTN